MLAELWNGFLDRIPPAYSDFLTFYLGNRYIVSALIIIAAVIGAKLLLLIFERYLQKFAAKTETEIDDLIFAKTKKPLFWLILIYGLKLAAANLIIEGWVTKLINSLMALIFVIIIAGIANIILDVWGKTVAKKTKSKLDDVLLPLFHKIINVIFGLATVLWIMKIWSVNITPYLAGAGIGGLILGLALQDSLKNILGGITLILDENFEVGDKVKLESGDLGEILDIGLRSTKIRTYDHEVIYVPNGYLANSRILNYTRPTAKIRVGVDFGVEYGNDIKKVQEVVTAVLNRMEEVLEDPAPAVQFLQMGDFSLTFKAYFWVPDWRKSYAKKLEATEKIYAALNKAKIGIPFPTSTVYLKK